MRFLKNKIQKAKEALHNKLTANSPSLSNKTLKLSSSTVKLEETQQSSPFSPIISPKETTKNTRKTANGESKKTTSSTKNITINYGKAIASFATSHLAIFYLEPYLITEGVTLSEFVGYINKAKDTIGGIHSFRSLLLIENKDEPKVMVYKKLFRMLSEVFIKYFSVNWIIHSKVTHKMVYLKYRSKMLRRVQNPEHFTYIKRVTKAAKGEKIEELE